MERVLLRNNIIVCNWFVYSVIIEFIFFNIQSIFMIYWYYTVNNWTINISNKINLLNKYTFIIVLVKSD